MQRIFAPFTLAVLISFHAQPAVRAQNKASLLPENRPVAEVIDHYIQAGYKASDVKPAHQAKDAVFLRRVTLDLVGRIPVKAEVDAYLQNTDPNKKIKLVDRLMNSPGFAAHQGERFATMMEVEGRNNDRLKEFVQESFAENRSWDAIFRELLLPDQADKKKAAASEFLKDRVRDLNRLTVDVSSLFFGVNVSCAQCHDHPHVNDWTQDHFYGMKSFFTRTVDNGGFIAERSFGAVEYTPHGGKPKVAPVMFLTGKTIDPPGMAPSKEEKKREQQLFNKFKKQKKPAPAPDYSLRKKLVEIALQPSEQHYFSRSIVNRVWYQFFGYGLVMPLDQMHAANLPSHPELLNWLARDMRSNKYDLRRLIRGIVLSDTYSLSSRLPSEDIPLDHEFAVSKIRALPPMPLARSLLIASTDPESIPSDEAKLQQFLEQIENRARGLASNFPEPGSKFQVAVEEAMFFSNNERIQNDLLQGGNSLASRLTEKKDATERAKYAIETVFSRPARKQEVQALANYLQQRESRLEDGCKQVVWALLTSSEFRFNH